LTLGKADGKFTLLPIMTIFRDMLLPSGKRVTLLCLDVRSDAVAGEILRCVILIAKKWERTV
jgi:hypothetical protein